MLNQEQVSELGKSTYLSNNIQRTMKKIKGIDAKDTTSYTSLIIANEWNEHNIGSACSCWNCGAHTHRLHKCEVTKNQDQIYAQKIIGKKRTTRSPEEVVTMSRENLTEATDRIVPSIMMVLMKTHMVQNHQ